MEDFAKLYRQLVETSQKTAILRSIQMQLEWDQETYMPSSSIDLRSKQLEVLADLVHKSAVSAKFKKILSALIDLRHAEPAPSDFSQEQQANLREWRRDYLKTAKLPASFVRTFAKTTSCALHAWQEAKKSNEFKIFLPHLEKIVQLNRKKADLFGFHDHPYNALIDIYEPEMTIAELNPIFAKLKLSLMNLLREIQTKPPPHCEFLFRYYPPHQQMVFAHLLLKEMGFPLDRSRLDLSMHPFCTGTPLDLRMTSHVDPENPMGNFFATLHEGGHGLYCLGRSTAHFGEPLSESVSLGVDESQSRFWETMIGHSLPFWHSFYPLLQEQFSQQLGGIDLEVFYRAINYVRPSLIRIHADEVTYSLHIILRFELEKALIEGNLKAKELPEAWNEKMREFLGIQPLKDSEGCLQDIHWAMGAMGYFPTYAIGNLYAAQLFETLQKTVPDWETKVSSGDLTFLREWLNEKIHKHGRLYPPKELMQRATKEPLSEKSYITYLETKYRSLYGI